MARISFITTRYKESCDLTDMRGVIDGLNMHGHTGRLIVYDKHEHQWDTYRFVPNVGRQNLAWFDYVLSTWSSPDDFYGFVDPASTTNRIHKFMKFASMCENAVYVLRNGGSFCIPGEPHTITVDPNYTRKFMHLGNDDAPDAHKIDNSRAPFTIVPHRNLGEWWADVSGGNPLPTRASTHGICMGSAANIQSWGRLFWERLYLDIIKSGQNGELSHYLERVMGAIASGRSGMRNQYVNVHGKTISVLPGIGLNAPRR